MHLPTLGASMEDMSEQQGPGAHDESLLGGGRAPAAQQESPSSEAAGERALRKDDTRGVVTGVCAGLGRFTGVDPVVWRTAFAMTVLAGGTGLWLYIGAWMMMRNGSGGPAMMEQLLNRRLTSRAVLALLTLGLAVATVLSLVGGFSSSSLVLSTPLILGLFVAQKRGVDLRQLARDLPGLLKSSEPPPTTPASAPKPAYYNPAQPWAQAPVGPIDLALVGSAARDAAPEGADPDDPDGPDDPDDLDDPEDPKDPNGSGSSADRGRKRAGEWHAERVKERRERRRAERKQRGVPLASLLCWVLFPTVIVAVYTFDVPWSALVGPDTGPLVVGSVTALVGGVLLLGAWFGNPRGLILLGSMLSVFLVVVSTVDVTALRFGDGQWRPETVAEAEGGYELTVGDAQLDLTRVPLEPGKPVEFDADVRFGVMTVLVPESAEVEVHSRMRVGRVVIDGQERAGTGLDVSRTLTAEGVPGKGADKENEGGQGPPTLVMNLRSYGGEVEVRRVSS